jgi:hypothetical protein
MRYIDLVHSMLNTKTYHSLRKRGVTGFDGDTEVSGACRALGVSLNLRENSNCQSRTGTRSLINCDVPPPDACGGGRSAMQQAGPRLVLSGRGREFSGLAVVLSRPMGVGDREI